MSAPAPDRRILTVLRLLERGWITHEEALKLLRISEQKEVAGATESTHGGDEERGEAIH